MYRSSGLEAWVIYSFVTTDVSDDKISHGLNLGLQPVYMVCL
jgi:hypothetical protein